VAVGVGVFIANILTIDRLTKLQSEGVKTITDADEDEDLKMTSEEQMLLDRAEGRVLLFHLSGPMIFGVAKAIAREHNAMEAHDVLVLDLHDVPILGVTAALALENAIQDASDNGRPVFIAGASEQAMKRFNKLGVHRFVPDAQIVETRIEALQGALALLDTDSGTSSAKVTPSTVIQP